MHKAGFVNIVGNPNVGKSTLMNLLVGEKISIATFKAQTTRHRIMGIINTDDMQIVFSDTPGVLKPNYKLQESMLNFSTSALVDADVLLYVTDVVETPETLAPGMIFCVDVGIYHEEWGIGFRLEDNCLVTEDGCENLSAATPRTVADIEAAMEG